MRIFPIRAAGLALAAAAATAPAQAPVVDTYWQRESGAKHFDELRPFRKPNENVVHSAGKLNELMHDLRAMMHIAAKADPKLLSYDKTGRQVCADEKWAAAYERVKANSLKMEGWVGKVLLVDGDVQRRQVAAYGIFYFNNPQDVFHLISYLPAEPVSEIREAGFDRALEFLRVHLPENKPQNPKRPDNGIVVPRFEFNPLPFMQLARTEKNIDRATALWFLTEVLRIRKDLGRAYFEELAPDLPKLLTAESKMVRTRAADFLAAIDPKPGRAPGPDAANEARTAWFEQLDKELFPPIRQVSLGVVDLYPSEDLDALVAAGQRVLADPDSFPHATAKVGKPPRHSTRFGVRVNSVPKPLEQLGIPLGSLIVAINAGPTRNKEELLRRIQMFFDQSKQRAEEYENQVKADRKANKPIRPRQISTLQVEFIHDGKAKMKEYRLRN